VSPALADELVDFWQRCGAMVDRGVALQRAPQAVAIARDDAGRIWGVGTAEVRVLPRLRQPMYYYRQFFADAHRGQGAAAPFTFAAQAILAAHHASLPAPEALGMLLEFENPLLDRRYRAACEGGFVFIGYSPRGHQLRAAYFDGACLLEPASLPQAASALAAE